MFTLNPWLVLDVKTERKCEAEHLGRGSDGLRLRGPINVVL